MIVVRPLPHHLPHPSEKQCEGRGSGSIPNCSAGYGELSNVIEEFCAEILHESFLCFLGKGLTLVWLPYSATG